MKLFSRLSALPDQYIFAGLVLISVLLRLPFLRSFEMVSYDGTYYINLARSVLDGTPVAGPFPLGYPLHVVPLMIFLDDVRAAQIASFIAAMGSLVALYYLGRQWLPRGFAYLPVGLLAASPLFMHYSMTTMSEAPYLCWLLFGLMFYARGRYTLAGAALGAATITRPEALPLFLLLAAMRYRERRELLYMVTTFAVVYAINAVAFSIGAGELVLLQKANNFALGAKSWQQLEGFFGREELREGIQQENTLVYYFKRLPVDTWLLLRHALVVTVPLAALGFMRQRSFLIFAVLPFLVFSLFTPRSEARFILPYLPMIFIYAAAAIASFAPAMRRNVTIAVAVAAAMGFFFNLGMVTTPLNPEFASAQETGRVLSEMITRPDRIADRKPFVPFYARGTFEKIPAAPYDDTIEHLVGRDVRLLSLHHPSTAVLRPAITPLLYDPAFILGEVRLRQLLQQNSGELIYEFTHEEVPLRQQYIEAPGSAPMVPSWSPNGDLLAYRVATGEGAGEIRVLSLNDGRTATVHRGQAPRDAISWSPDSRRIVFSERVGGSESLQILDLDTSQLEVVTDAGGSDVSPSWSPSGDEIVFSSNRNGKSHIFVLLVESRAVIQITAAGHNRFPAIAPDNERIAWIQEGTGVLISDRRTGQTLQATAPADPTNAPTWSADGRFLAVQGRVDALGAAHIYLVRGDGKTALLLTRKGDGQVMPSWHPGGQGIAVVARQGDALKLSLLSGIEPYCDRLLQPPRIYTFEQPAAP